MEQFTIMKKSMNAIYNKTVKLVYSFKNLAD